MHGLLNFISTSQWIPNRRTQASLNPTDASRNVHSGTCSRHRKHILPTANIIGKKTRNIPTGFVDCTAKAAQLSTKTLRLLAQLALSLPNCHPYLEFLRQRREKSFFPLFFFFLGTVEIHFGVHSWTFTPYLIWPGSRYRGQTDFLDQFKLRQTGWDECPWLTESGVIMWLA